MFGILYGLFSLFALGVDHHNKTSQDEKNKQLAKQSGSLTYYGSRGNEYLVENDRWVSTKRLPTGEDVIADMKTGEVYYNLTRIKKEKAKEKQLAKGKTVRSAVKGENFGTYYGKYKQRWYDIDIKTNTPVHTIFVNCATFYQELDHGMLLRPTDNETLKYFSGKHTVDEIIELFNKRQQSMQDVVKENENDRFWLSRNYLFDKHHYIYIDNNNKFNIFYTGSNNGNANMWYYIKKDNKEV